MKYEVMCNPDGTTEAKNLNRRKAIALHCLVCSGHSRKDRRWCDHTGCQLYPYRCGNNKPKPDPKERAKAVTCYCTACVNGQVSEKRYCPRDCILFPWRYSRVDKSIEINSQ